MLRILDEEHDLSWLDNVEPLARAGLWGRILRCLHNYCARYAVPESALVEQVGASAENLSGVFYVPGGSPAYHNRHHVEDLLSVVGVDSATFSSSIVHLDSFLARRLRSDLVGAVLNKMDAETLSDEQSQKAQRLWLYTLSETLCDEGYRPIVSFEPDPLLTVDHMGVVYMFRVDLLRKKWTVTTSDSQTGYCLDLVNQTLKALFRHGQSKNRRTPHHRAGAQI